MVSQNEIDYEDVEDALRRAEELSEITGRKKTDIVADLLDDGQLNYSAGTDAEVKKDLLDVAQEKAEKLKTLLTTLIPVFALLMGIGAEGLGFVDITGWGSESMWDEDPNNPDNNVVYWGCMDINAENYDYMATKDDGSCHFIEDDCNPDWIYDDYSSSNEDSIFVRFTFVDTNKCDVELEGHFTIVLFMNGSSYDDDYIGVGVFTNDIEVQSDFNELDEGNYEYEIEFHTIECADGTCEHGDEFNSPHKPTFNIQEPAICDAYLINEQAYILEDSDNSIRISADVAIHADSESSCDSEQFELIWRLYKDNVMAYEHTTWEDGIVSDSDGADYATHAWYNVSVGTYHPKVILHLNNDILEEKWIAHTVSIEPQPIYGCIDSEATNYNSNADTDDGSCEYAPQKCEINLFSISLFTNSTHASVGYDLDCGYSDNDLQGYNVSVQFLVYQVNATSQEGNIEYKTTMCYVQGWISDTKYLLLDNFTDNNTTHYDFYWYAMWTDGDGEQQIMERSWLNRELNP